MAKNKLKLVNESRQGRTVLLLKKGAGESCLAPANGSVDITKSEVSPQLQAMLDKPSAFGLRLQEEQEKPSSRASKKSKDEDKEDE